MFFFFFSSRRRHTRLTCDWSSDVCSSDLGGGHIEWRVGRRPGQMHRRHADIVHEADAKAHREGARPDAKRWRPRRMSHVGADADYDDANKEGDEGRQHEIVDRAWKIRGEHRDK